MYENEYTIETFTGTEWEDCKTSMWTDLTEKGWKFAYYDPETECITMVRDGYINEFRMKKKVVKK